MKDAMDILSFNLPVNVVYFSFKMNETMNFFCLVGLIMNSRHLSKASKISITNMVEFQRKEALQSVISCISNHF